MEFTSVSQAAAWFDEHLPGWEDKIDLSTLNIDDSCNCILGQLYGDYCKGKQAVTEKDALTVVRAGWPFVGLDWETMTPTQPQWITEILIRRAANEVKRTQKVAHVRA